MRYREFSKQKLNEIELSLGIVPLPIGMIRKYLQQSTLIADDPDSTFQIYKFINIKKDLVIIVVDKLDDEIAAPSIFAYLHSNYYQVNHSQVFNNYKGNALVAKIYEFCIKYMNMVILSDSEQSLDAQRLWTKTLPRMGIIPKIIDTKTGDIFQNNNSINVYSNQKYCWIIGV